MIPTYSSIIIYNRYTTSKRLHKTTMHPCITKIVYIYIYIIFKVLKAEFATLLRKFAGKPARPIYLYNPFWGGTSDWVWCVIVRVFSGAHTSFSRFLPSLGEGLGCNPGEWRWMSESREGVWAWNPWWNTRSDWGATLGKRRAERSSWPNPWNEKWNSNV
jgi:hypothetical protein